MKTSHPLNLTFFQFSWLKPWSSTFNNLLSVTSYVRTVLSPACFASCSVDTESKSFSHFDLAATDWLTSALLFSSYHIIHCQVPLSLERFPLILISQELNWFTPTLLASLHFSAKFSKLSRLRPSLADVASFFSYGFLPFCSLPAYISVSSQSLYTTLSVLISCRNSVPLSE